MRVISWTHPHGSETLSSLFDLAKAVFFHFTCGSNPRLQKGGWADALFLKVLIHNDTVLVQSFQLIFVKNISRQIYLTREWRPLTSVLLFLVCLEPSRQLKEMKLRWVYWNLTTLSTFFLPLRYFSFQHSVVQCVGSPLGVPAEGGADSGNWWPTAGRELDKLPTGKEDEPSVMCPIFNCEQCILCWVHPWKLSDSVMCRAVYDISKCGKFSMSTTVC